MNMDQLKNEDDKDLFIVEDQELREDWDLEDRLPEFDEIGTPLNAL